MTETPHNSEQEEQIQEDMEYCRAFISSMDRGIVKEFPGLKTFNQSDHSAEIKGMAHGMTIQEICDFYGVALENFSDDDKFFFCTMFLKGRASGTLKATTKLFNQMSERDGVKASLAYLSRFGENWENIEKTGAALSGAPKAVRIELID